MVCSMEGLAPRKRKGSCERAMRGCQGKNLASGFVMSPNRGENRVSASSCVTRWYRRLWPNPLTILDGVCQPQQAKLRNQKREGKPLQQQEPHLPRPARSARVQSHAQQRSKPKEAPLPLLQQHQQKMACLDRGAIYNAERLPQLTEVGCPWSFTRSIVVSSGTSARIRDSGNRAIAMRQIDTPTDCTGHRNHISHTEFTSDASACNPVYRCRCCTACPCPCTYA